MKKIKEHFCYRARKISTNKKTSYIYSREMGKKKLIFRICLLYFYLCYFGICYFMLCEEKFYHIYLSKNIVKIYQ